MATLLETLDAALARHDHQRAREALSRLLAAAPSVHDVAHHLALGSAAEELGEWGWAETAYNLVLREDPGHPEALDRLAKLAEERGDPERAAIQRERLAEARPEDRENLIGLLSLYRRLRWSDQERRVAERLEALGVRLEAEDVAVPETPPRDEAEGAEPDLAVVANPAEADIARFLALFSGREDVHARQWFNPRKGVAGYSPVEEPLTARLVRQHLFGDLTLGVYPIRLDGTCLFFAVDLDLTKAAIDFARRGPEEARRVREALRSAVRTTTQRLQAIGLDPLIEDSGHKGRHFWFFLERPEPADLLHGFGRLLLRYLGDDLPGGIALEFFPRQPKRRGKGLGNLIKLPLGVHRKTGRRAWLLEADGKPHPRPFEKLAAVQRISHRKLLEAMDRVAGLLGEPSAVPEEPAPAQPPWDGQDQAAIPEVREETGVAPPQPPPWTEADYERYPHIAAVLAGCAVLDELKRTALETRVLSHDQQIVLLHTLGHLPGGVPAVNYLLDRCPGVPEERKLKSPLRGNPISCPKIRQRIPEVTARVGCSCQFDLGDGAYPTPVLHARDVPADAGPAQQVSGSPDVREMAERYLALRDRIDRLKAELVEIEKTLSRLLRAAGGSVAAGEGTLSLVVRDGTETLEWRRGGGSQ